jgi:transposase InsO family protein
MPWMETTPVTERERFIEAWGGGQTPIAELARAFGISRKTAYKWIKRFTAEGRIGLKDRSRARRTQRRTTRDARRAVVGARRAHPTWGPRKIRGLLLREGEITVPAASTIGQIIDSSGLVTKRDRPQPRASGYASTLTQPTAPNCVWTADYKGDFRVGNGTRCYPLAVRDAHSRFLLECEALASTSADAATRILTGAFREYGMPWVFRTDNGTPFASVGLCGLSELAVWLIKLGIRPERIRPGRPQQNGAHERLNRDIKAETILPPADSLVAQQRRFDRFRHIFNYERPHEALGGEVPASVYTRSSREMPRRVESPTYPPHFEVRTIDAAGTLRWNGWRFFLSGALAHEPVGLEAVSDGAWTIHFGMVRLGVVNVALRKPALITDVRTVLAYKN